MPDSTTLVSGSEDCTLKLWDLGQLAASNHQHINPMQVSEVAPYLTLRGHTGPILSIGNKDETGSNLS